MANTTPILGLRPGWWILILSSILVAAIIVIPIVVVKTSESSTPTPGGPVINIGDGGNGSNGGAGGTTQGPTSTSTSAPTLAPTISPNTTNTTSIPPTLTPTLSPTPTPAPDATVRPTTVPPPTLPPFNHTDKRPDVNIQIFHLSDIHGYIGQKRYGGTWNQNGVPYELNGDWGDFLSMVAHARANAAASGSEFLLFDTGDLVDGAAYSDITSPRGVNMMSAISQAHYDGFAPGNHDLGYVDTISLLQATSNETNMITSNIAFDGKPLGASYRILSLKSGYRVLVLGFLFDFTAFVGENISVTSILDGTLYDANNKKKKPNTNLIFANQPYFKQAMGEPNIDLIVTLGHMSIQAAPEGDYFLQIFNTIRKFKPATPIIQLGGHGHSTRFNTTREVYSPSTGKPGVFAMDTNNQFRTIGTVNIRLGPNPVANGTRIIVDRYLAVVTNNGTMAAFVNRTLVPDTFSTPIGTTMKAQLKQWASDYGLDRIRACWNKPTLRPNGDTTRGADRVTTNLYPLWTDVVLPTYFVPNTPSIQYFIAASASLRSPLNQGTVTEEDIFNILPFNDDIMYFKNLTVAQFQQALYHAQARTFGAVAIRKRTECVHEERNDRVTAHAPSDVHEMFMEEPVQQNTIVKGGQTYTIPKQYTYQTKSITRTRMHKMQLPPSAPTQVTISDRPFMYYGTQLPVLKPVKAMYGRTFFTFADIAGSYRTPASRSDYQDDIDAYNLPRNRTDQISIVAAFFEQYGNRTFDLITSRYHAVQLFQTLIFPANNGSATYGYPTGDAAKAQIYPGNSIAYPGAPINATHLLRTYLFNNYKCTNLTTTLD